MIFKDVTNFTSPPIDIAEGMRDAFITVTGAIEITVEIKQQDGVWRSFPETTLTGPKAAVLKFPAGQIRVKTVDGPATITVDL